MNIQETSATEGHIYSRYDRELNALVQQVSTMGKLVVKQVKEAGKAIKRGDVDRARKILENEERIDEMDGQAEQEIHRILALRQPMAKDLRAILTVNRMVSYLERIGDQTKNIAKLCIRLYEKSESPPDDKLVSGIPRMAKYVQTMVSMSIRAFEEMDMELALEVLEMYDELNDQFDNSIRSVTTFVMADARRVGQAVDVVLGLRSLDRIGGHAMSISKQIIFMVSGASVRHESQDVVVAEVRSAKIL